MGDIRQRYNEEFKKQTVKYIQENTKTTQQIAEELNIPAGTLYEWVAKYRDLRHEPLDGKDKILELEQRLRELELANRKTEREKADLREEVAILKKAVHIFSSPKN